MSLNIPSNPVEVINNVSKYLKKGGLFFFAINNIDSLVVKIMHEHSPTFIGPHHSVHYGVNNLNILMDSYKLVHSESYVSDIEYSELNVFLVFIIFYFF